MKTYRKIYLVMILILLVGCDRFNELDSVGVLTPVESSDNSKSEQVNTYTNIKNDDILIRDEVYSDTSSENCDINIKYPQITILGKDTSYINYIIYNFVFDIIPLNNDNTGVTLDIDYKITIKNKYMISIIFNGYYFKEKMAYGTQINKSISIDLKKSKRMILEMTYNIDESFIELYIKNTKKQLAEITNDEYDYLDVFDSFCYSDEYCELYNVDLVDRISSYYTEDALIITIDIRYALGGYFETIIKYDQLMPFIKKDSLLYEVLSNRNTEEN